MFPVFRQFLLSVSVFCFSSLGGWAGEDRPNFLVIAIDDLNDYVGSLGGHPNASTPNLNRLAKTGVLFTSAHCVSPVCNPLRTAIWTGLRPTLPPAFIPILLDGFGKSPVFKTL
jgi:hypothetical protein